MQRKNKKTHLLPLKEPSYTQRVPKKIYRAAKLAQKKRRKIEGQKAPVKKVYTK